MLTTTSLLKVKTLSKSHAKQIRVLYQLDHSTIKAVRLRMKPVEMGGSAATKPVGWIDGKTLADLGIRHVNTTSRHWLVVDGNDLYWDTAPRPDSDAGETYALLDQLFV